MDFIQKRPGLSVLLAFAVGLFIGLVVLGWWLWPVEWTGAGPGELSEADQALYVRAVAERYSFDGNAEKVREALGSWGGDAVACRLAQSSTAPDDRARLEAVAAVINGQGCAPFAQESPTTSAPQQEGGNNFLTLILGLILFILLGAILVVLRRRRELMAGVGPAAIEVPDSAPISTGEEATAIPLARFQTTYNFGHDAYDDSFSIETAEGEFLGECGVGISESIGADTPKNVTAFEVWLFDKNDIRTVTKVVMSDHAFFDEALKAKLAPKGEPVLARENEVIVLETASLIINAEIKEMVYGTAESLPPQSYFERMTIELSAWAKEGEYPEPDVQGRVDEIMNY
ncbi:MAG: hypothetical protein D6706_10390 [Chloroflexi bacterium]|nr:MAG: hypothetical protein D6706_10390 [Chloroflexota bacterium]